MPFDALQADTQPAQLRVCFHCGRALAVHDVEFCCAGCRTAHRLLHEEGLTDYYRLAGGAITPPNDGPRDHAWLDAVTPVVGQAIVLSVQGVHCVGCVYLIEEVARRHNFFATLNPTVGKLVLEPKDEVASDPTASSLRAFATHIEQFGYVLDRDNGTERAQPSVRALAIRTAIAFALTANAMMFALATYLGLRAGPVFVLMDTLVRVLSLSTVLVGAPVFVRAAYGAIATGRLNLDVPIALGMVLAGTASVFAWISGSHSNYGDTLAVFVTLMLLGRLLNERVLARNQARILDRREGEGLVARVVIEGQYRIRPFGEVVRGVELAPAAQEMLPTRAQLLSDVASFSLETITGESEPRQYLQGAIVPAGAVSQETRYVRLRALESYSESPLASLLSRQRRLNAGSQFWSRLVFAWVLFVLSAALVAFAIAWHQGQTWLEAIDRVVAVLIVTCPCGVGIATPLAYEIAYRALERRGLLVRSGGLLEALRRVRRVVFDKTGTLTEASVLQLDAASLRGLSDQDARALHDLAGASSHPNAGALSAALTVDHDWRARIQALASHETREMNELPGCGVTLLHDGVHYFLGRSASESAELMFSKDDTPLLLFSLVERAVPGAANVVSSLRARGLSVWMLSGDKFARAQSMANALGIAPEQVIAEQSGDNKAQWLQRHGADETLFVGDGLNDLAAAQHARAVGAALTHRPFMAQRADFYLSARNLDAMPLLFAISHRIGRIQNRNLVLAVVYNVLAISIACSGAMRPWMAAVLMPLSSLVLVLSSVTTMRRTIRRAT